MTTQNKQSLKKEIKLTIIETEASGNPAYLVDCENGDCILLTDYNIYEQLYILIHNKMHESKNPISEDDKGIGKVGFFFNNEDG